MIDDVGCFVMVDALAADGITADNEIEDVFIRARLWVEKQHPQLVQLAERYDGYTPNKSGEPETHAYNYLLSKIYERMLQKLGHVGAELPRMAVTAHHEAGHAVVRVVVGLRPTAVHIYSHAIENSLFVDRTGFTQGDGMLRTGVEWIEASILYGLAGAYAESRHSGASIEHVFAHGARDDLAATRSAHQRIEWLGTQWETCCEDARYLVDKHWDAIERVAAALVERRTLMPWSVRGLIGALPAQR